MNQTIRRYAWPIAALAFLLLLLVCATAAYAHVATHGKDYSRLYNNNQTLEACDKERDGNPVTAQGATASGRTFGVRDRTGADAYCKFKNPSAFPAFVKHRICEKGKGCGAWKRH